MDEKPERRWFDRYVWGQPLAEWIGLALLTIGGGGAQGASDRAVKDQQAWSPVAVLVLAPICCLGGALIIWSVRRQRMLNRAPASANHRDAVDRSKERDGSR